MSLITELGGYTCALAEYNDPKYIDDELYTIKATGTKFFKCNLGEELLEYRKKNKIYEKGDSVKCELTGCVGDFIKYTDIPNEHCLVDFGLTDAGLLSVHKLTHFTRPDNT